MRIALKIDLEGERGETRSDEAKMLELVAGVVKEFTDEITKRARENELEVTLGKR